MIVHMRLFNREFTKIFKATQELLGPSEPNWKIGPIKIEGSNYPETTCDEVTRDVTVRATVSTLADPLQRTYQLTHESVHCLSPRNRRDTLFFEEGMANWYTLTSASLPEDYRRKAARTLEPLLAKPYNLFLQLNPTFQKIVALRKDCLGLDDVTPELIIKSFSTTAALASMLTERLPKDRPEKML